MRRGRSTPAKAEASTTTAAAKTGDMQGVRCAITGGSGFVGQRLVEMALGRGAALVVSFDISPPPKYITGGVDKGGDDAAWDNSDALAAMVGEAQADGRLVYVQGDITKLQDVERMVAGPTGDVPVDIVYHVAALVGPFHPQEAYVRVNYEGTVNVIEACKKNGVAKIVMSSSPSTRFDPHNLDISGLREEQLMFPDERDPPRGYTAEYARTKAMGERLLRAENGSKLYNGNARGADQLLTVAVAPHQVYGPRDSLFLPNLLRSAGTGQLRIFGSGENMISMTHVDNYCHALLLAGACLEPGSKILGKFYIATDGGAYKFWRIIDEAGMVRRSRQRTRTHRPQSIMRSNRVYAALASPSPDD